MPRYTNTEKNRPFSGLQHQAQFGLNPALQSTVISVSVCLFVCLLKYCKTTHPHCTLLDAIHLAINHSERKKTTHINKEHGP